MTDLLHDIEVITTTHQSWNDYARIRFRCNGCHLKGTVIASPAKTAAGILAAARQAPCDGHQMSQWAESRAAMLGKR